MLTAPLVPAFLAAWPAISKICSWLARLVSDHREYNVPDVLTFVQRPDGTLVATSAQSTTDGTTVNVTGKTVTTTPTVATDALAIVMQDDKGNEVQQLFGPDYSG